jgi:hypothetical protein
LTLFFIAALALFFVVTMPLKASPEVAALGFEPVKIVRMLIIFSAVIWLLPITEMPPKASWQWTGSYFLSAAVSLAALAWGTRVKIDIGRGALKPESAVDLLLVIAAPFVFYYAASGALFTDLGAVLTESLLDRRFRMWEEFGEGDRIKLVLGFLAYPAAHVWALRSPRSLAFWWSVVVFVLFVVVGSATGGRMMLIFSTVVCGLLLHMKYDLSPRRMLKGRIFSSILLAMLTCWLAYYVLYYVMSERIPQMATRYEHISYLVTGAYPSRWMLDLNDATNGAAGSVALNLGYFSSSITFYQTFMASPCCEGQVGVYNFPFLGAVMDASWFDIRDEIAYYWTRQGLSPNPWATAWRDWYIDFGFVGSFAFSIAVFATLGMVLRSVAVQRTSYAWLVAAYTMGMLLVMPLLSPLLIQVISIPYYSMLALYVFVGQTAGSKQSTGPSAPRRAAQA